MKQQTIATLRQLDGIDWFSAVGLVDSEAVNVLPTWAEAVQSAVSIEWQNLCLEAVNQYRDRISEREPDRLDPWNDLVAEIKEVSVPLVQRKVQSVVQTNSLPEGFIDTVEWDVLHLALESEYSDVYPPGFYAAQAYWYACGHFPCGWNGDFPSGKLIVY